MSTAVHDFARFANTYEVKKSTLREIDRELKRGLVRFSSPSVTKTISSNEQT